MPDAGNCCVGSLAAGFLLFAACAAASLLGGLVVIRLSYDAPPRSNAAGGGGHEMLQGFATIAANRGLALITALGVVQTFTRGCLTVFTVVVAIDLLGTGDPGVGVLTAAVGAGGMFGSILAFGLVGRGRLALWFGVGVALFGAPLVGIGVVLAGEDVAGAAHVGSQLINFIESLVDRAADVVGVTQIGDDEIIGLGFGVLIELQVDSAHPEAFPLQSFDQMAADKAAGAGDKNPGFTLHYEPL